MAINLKSVPLSTKQVDDIEKAMLEKGYFLPGYVTPARTVDTDVACPICGEDLSLYMSGNSHQIKCKTSPCVVINFRGL